MKQLIPMDDLGVFADIRDTARANSLIVARMFGKRHDNVLRDVEALDCSSEFRLLNFEESYYRNEQGKRQPCINMTRDGFVFLVMGYRGKRAAAIKEAYIARFNEMEAFIRTLITARSDFKLLTDSVALIHEQPSQHHFSNECNLINRLVTGMDAKRFREAHGLEKGQSIRPYLTPEQLYLLDALQKADIGLLIAFPDYAQRKRCLEQHKDRLLGRMRLGA